jgi:DDE superfamily endonuclease
MRRGRQCCILSCWVEPWPRAISSAPSVVGDAGGLGGPSPRAKPPASMARSGIAKWRNDGAVTRRQLAATPTCVMGRHFRPDTGVASFRGGRECVGQRRHCCELLAPRFLPAAEGTSLPIVHMRSHAHHGQSDNLSTHKPASLYEAFPVAEARRLVERFEWHYTPKHGSWLNMAESELSVLSGQCLLDVGRTVSREVGAVASPQRGDECAMLARDVCQLLFRWRLSGPGCSNSSFSFAVQVGV